MMRQRGFTVVEVLVALFVASLLSVFVLSLTRSQLVTYEMQSQTNSVQENTRESFDFVETLLRRACGGISKGQVEIRLSDSNHFPTECVRVYDGAAIGTGATPAVGSAGSFTSTSPASAADAIEIIYGDGANLSMVTGTTSGTTLNVADITPFTGLDGQLILVSNMQYGYVFRQASHNPTTATGTATGTIVLSGISAIPSTYFTIQGDGNCYVMPAKVYSLYIDTATDSRNPMLRLDPDGVAGTTHDDAEPLAEGVEDLQVAIGVDGYPSGTTFDGFLSDTSSSSDEWLGNAGTTEITANFPGTLPWSTESIPNGTTVAIVPRAIRLTLLLRSLNQYAGTPFAVSPAENRGTASGWNWTTVSNGTATVAPRFRQLRMVVAPRAWNTAE